MCRCHSVMSLFFFFKQKTAYEMRISDWSSDVCSSYLLSPNGTCDSIINHPSPSHVSPMTPDSPIDVPQRLIIGISGASGVRYGVRMLEILRDPLVRASWRESVGPYV